MKKEANIFLQHILDSIEKIEEFTLGLSKDGFIRSAKSQDAVIRRLEIIGEATKNLPKNFREEHNEVPWNEIAKTGDKLIRGYFGIDLSITWNVVKNDLPDLKNKVKKILEQAKL